MKKLPSISDTEWQVMKVLWTNSPITSSQVIEQLEGVTSWKPKTVKTLLGRLVRKNAVGFTQEGRSYLYYPLVTEDACVKEESRSFLERVYGGALSVLLTNFLEDQDLTKDEIDQLKSILDKKKE
ncbi:BlaI/MecI/CopY family transcriptional regulator [Geosporobacter ferrireducens]|uniref:Transcriptional regulator n=1 Tax=Geosporobacter ferrireducens TaxID=1424294 RepID=A0A1D8GF95_9FIRM|nr:BlaI/MecI/CopY family transcriptional regulator [Geosporobacter ferrireducens]AOT69573.1 transcriptional regulator [Geosporobacter ferrireducens]MTI54732.1 BlaI/MecI/CopY family transcriptional regulator [Geosporobacter ferrireducens]